MKSKKQIIEALKQVEIRRKGYMLDMLRIPTPGDVRYDTEIIRKLEIIQK